MDQHVLLLSRADKISRPASPVNQKSEAALYTLRFLELPKKSSNI